MKKFLITLLILSYTTSADASPRWVKWLYRSSQIVAAGGHGADLYSTGRCLSSRKGIETNPLLKKIDDPILFGTTKATVAAGSLIIVDKVAERDTKHMVWGSILNFTVGSVLYGVAEHNVRVCK